MCMSTATDQKIDRRVILEHFTSDKLTEGSFLNISHQTSVSLAGLSNVMHAFDAYAEKAVFQKSKRKPGLARISPTLDSSLLI